LRYYLKNILILMLTKMNKEKILELKKQYADALFLDVVPFWIKNSIDKDCGGYFTCLDRDGSVYDKDKFIWLQARQVWTFSMLYNRYEKNPEWLDIAKHGIDFLEKYGRDKDGNWYFALSQEGFPLVQPYNIFSDCFAALAFGEYALASGDDHCRKISLDTYNNILSRQGNPKGKYTKTIGRNRPLQSFSLPMILANLTRELKWMFNADDYNKFTGIFIDKVMNQFLDQKRMLIFENILSDGSHIDTFEGRLINPGHGIEGMWFVMELAAERNDLQTINKAIDTVLSILDFSWDKKNGGIFYFLDSEGKPPLALEWDQKLWWVHIESLIALLMGYSLTGSEKCAEWFKIMHDYTWSHFPDPQYGEWYGYLNRQGEPLLPLKGGKWKGCYHVPRGLFRCYSLLEQLLK